MKERALNEARLREVLEPDDDIDRAVREFSAWYYKVADAYEDISRDVDAHKAAYDLVYAKTLEKLLTGKEKITAKLAELKCETNVEVVDAAARLRGKKAAMGKLSALLKAYDKKSSMLKAEVELVVSRYSQRDHIKPRTPVVTPMFNKKSRS